jgi:protein-L-isoaspartate(D-aspartate) O-methyltransferase
MRIFGRRDPSIDRRDMVESQIRRRGIVDPRVLRAMLTVPRHRFVPQPLQRASHADCALPIGRGATISQPYIVALMSASLELDVERLRVLEIGTGSGYQAAVLAECGCDVYSVERIEALHRAAGRLLTELGYGDRVHLRLGDGSRGWPEEAPFDRVMLTAAAPEVPPELLLQTAEGGLLVAPVGDERSQVIRAYRRRGDRWEIRDIEGARFVPLIEDRSTPRRR